MKLGSPSWLRRKFGNQPVRADRTKSPQQEKLSKLPDLESVPSVRQIAAEGFPGNHTTWDSTLRRAVALKIRAIVSIQEEAKSNGQCPR